MDSLGVLLPSTGLTERLLWLPSYSIGDRGRSVMSSYAMTWIYTIFHAFKRTVSFYGINVSCDLCGYVGSRPRTFDIRCDMVFDIGTFWNDYLMYARVYFAVHLSCI